MNWRADRRIDEIELEGGGMIDNEQIAHGLALAYINNRYGVEVAGSFDVSTVGEDVTGSGTVETERLPDVDSKKMVRVGTGQKHLFGLREKKVWVDSGTYEVDAIFTQMIDDYYGAYARFLGLLAHTPLPREIGEDDTASAE